MCKGFQNCYWDKPVPERLFLLHSKYAIIQGAGTQTQEVEWKAIKTVVEKCVCSTVRKICNGNLWRWICLYSLVYHHVAPYTPPEAFCASYISVPRS